MPLGQIFLHNDNSAKLGPSLELLDRSIYAQSIRNQLRGSPEFAYQQTLLYLVLPDREGVAKTVTA